MYTTAHWFKSHLKDVPRRECFELMQGRQVGRIAFVDPEGPVILPINFAIHEDQVLIATSPTGRLAHHAVGQSVGFEVDEIDEFTEIGWSVLVRGNASVVSGDELPEEANRPNSWVDGNRTLFIRISPTQVTGRYLMPA